VRVSRGRAVVGESDRVGAEHAVDSPALAWSPKLKPAVTTV
jgi:hypothetical protein